MKVCLNKLILITGPTKSGKSEFAEKLVSESKDILYIATSDPIPGDVSWQKKIDKHKIRRPKHWQLIECNKLLSNIIDSSVHNNTLLIDSLGGYVSSLLHTDDEEWLKFKSEFLLSIQRRNCLIVVVIEETGWGVVPSSRLGCCFRDRLGELSRELEVLSDEMWLVINGRVLDLTKLGIRI